MHARDPQRAAEDLAALVGGVARPFHPCEGAWVCFLSGHDDDWDGQLLEFYPRDVALTNDKGKLIFKRGKGSVRPGGAATHFNISVPKTRRALEADCKELHLESSWRDWQGLLEVWLEVDLLIECVPSRAAGDVLV